MTINECIWVSTSTCKVWEDGVNPGQQAIVGEDECHNKASHTVICYFVVCPLLGEKGLVYYTSLSTEEVPKFSR